ncbi:MAG: hypothetical protein AAF609_15570, partial [Cyanobacteria bacterium P01_C01_bin.120]
APQPIALKATALALALAAVGRRSPFARLPALYPSLWPSLTKQHIPSKFLQVSRNLQESPSILLTGRVAYSDRLAISRWAAGM